MNVQTTFLKIEALNQLIKFKYHGTIQKSLWEIIKHQKKEKKKRKKENKKASLSQEEIEHTNLLIYLER